MTLSPKLFKKLALKALIFYILVVIFMAIFQRNFIYFPFGEIASPPENFQEINFEIDSKNSLYVWYHPPQKNQKTILYFHGNAGNISGRSERLKKFATQYGVLAVSYRGYSKTKGEASEQNFYSDAQIALNLLNLQKIDNKNIIVFGESIGTAVAVNLASKYDFASIVLEAPFTSIADVAKDVYWFLPVDLILRDKFDSAKLAPQIKSPVVIFHAIQDDIVPFELGKKLYELINSKKKFMAIDGNFHIALSPEFLLDNINKFLEENKLE